MPFSKLLLSFVIALSLLISVIQPAHADIAPPHIPSFGGLGVWGYQKTEVQMVYERVEMEVIPDASYKDGDDGFPTNKVEVRAYFLMRNTSDQIEIMQAVFPQGDLACDPGGNGGSDSFNMYTTDLDSFKVTVDGGPTEIGQVIISPDESAAKGCWQEEWFSFDATFPPGRDVVVIVDYTLVAQGVDPFENFEYVLETGAGWKGPIERGYIVIKFPYLVSNQVVLEGTSPGYQTLYNEIFWSFQNLEPERKDNIRVNMVAPNTWLQVLALRDSAREFPGLAENWLKLADIHRWVSSYGKGTVRSAVHANLMAETYQRGMEANPLNADLSAEYAAYLFYDCCAYSSDIKDSTLSSILPLLNNALALSPKNETAMSLFTQIQNLRPDLGLSLPATIAPTTTLTPTVTPTASQTLAPSATKPTTPTKTTTPSSQPATETPLPTMTATVGVTASPTSEPTDSAALGLPENSEILNWLAGSVLLLIGMILGVILSRKKL